MRKQQQFWEQEHTSGIALPSMQPIKPSSFVVMFQEFLAGRVENNASLIDIGCGKGRNAIYMALQGYQVTAIDYSHIALDFARRRAYEQHAKVKFLLKEIDSMWNFPNNEFSVAIDCFSSIDIESLEGRKKYRSELYRTLKPRGYALVVVVATEDELEKELMATSPGREPHSSMWPSGKFQKNYDEQELRDFYKEFTVVELRKLSKPTEKLGRKYTATNYWMVLQKK